MTKTPITLFATYWNECDWIEASLAQIDAINPREVIICDGCFDPTRPNQSTDGTREIIEAWVAERPHARMISALQLSRFSGLWYIFGKHIRFSTLPLRIFMFFYYLRTNVYRINQAATFTHMSRLSKYWGEGSWFMNIDADQFYPEDMIKIFHKECADTTSTTELLTATEKTFFHDFDTYTDEYEKRNYNNMPHRVKKNTLIVPTRDIITEAFPRPRVYGKDPQIQKKNVGSYFHYKFRPHTKTREQEGYTLGDRKAPETKKYTSHQFDDTHPNTIQSLIKKTKLRS